MFLIDFEEDGMIPDEEIKNRVSKNFPIRLGKNQIIDIQDLKHPKQNIKQTI